MNNFILLTTSTELACIELPQKQLQYDFDDIDDVINSLSIKLRKFALHYARTLNKTQSARAAGFTEKRSGQRGHLLCKNSKIQRYVLYLLHLDRTLGKITKEDILRRCNEILLNYRSAGAKMSALNLIAKLTGLDGGYKSQSVFGDNNLITINIIKKTEE